MQCSNEKVFVARRRWRWNGNHKFPKHTPYTGKLRKCVIRIRVTRSTSCAAL
jgi:hypothetical protein